MTDRQGWAYFSPTLVEGEMTIREYAPEHPGEFHYRYRPVGLRIECEWYDDATFRWTSKGVYKDLDDMRSDLPNG